MKNTNQANYKYIFGPVPSRRLGTSLGIDLVPHKTCSLDCVYCECGRTTSLTIKRDEYVPVNSVIRELDEFIEHSPAFDTITFSGSGEPTLHKNLDLIITHIKTDFPQYKIAVLTNGTLLYQPEVVESVLQADIVKISIDAVSEKIFSAVNRPHPELKISSVLEGIMDYKKKGTGELWIEVFLVKGQNDNDAELMEINKIISILNPDKIQFNTADRPCAESWVEPVSENTILEISSKFNGSVIIEDPVYDYQVACFTGDFDNQVISAIKRRPFTAKDISQILDKDFEYVNSHLSGLVKLGKIQKKKMPRGVFYAVKF